MGMVRMAADGPADGPDRREYKPTASFRSRYTPRPAGSRTGAQRTALRPSKDRGPSAKARRTATDRTHRQPWIVASVEDGLAGNSGFERSPIGYLRGP